MNVLAMLCATLFATVLAGCEPRTPTPSTAPGGTATSPAPPASAASR
jgi:hypothetical protein